MCAPQNVSLIHVSFVTFCAYSQSERGIRNVRRRSHRENRANSQPVIVWANRVEVNETRVSFSRILFFGTANFFIYFISRQTRLCLFGHTEISPI